MDVNKSFHVTMATISVSSSSVYISILSLDLHYSLSLHTISRVRHIVAFISVVQTIYGGVHAFMMDLQAERWVCVRKQDKVNKKSQSHNNKSHDKIPRRFVLVWHDSFPAKSGSLKFHGN